MIAKEVNYQWHFDEFLRQREHDRSLRMSRYCEDAGIRRQRMYEWMTRRGLSLKGIYAGASGTDLQPVTGDGLPSPTPAFSPLRIAAPSDQPLQGQGLGRIRITLPTGAGIEIERCTVGELLVLTGGPLNVSHV